MERILETARLPHLIGNYPENNLNLKFSFDALSSILSAMEELYGLQGGRGLACRTGRACFKYGLREFGPPLGVTDLTFRLLPLKKKLLLGADAFAGVFNQFSDQRVRVEKTEDVLLFHLESCAMCLKRQSDCPECYLAVGILQEALFWVSGGRHFTVEATSCIAARSQTGTIAVHY